jgi:ketopantoate reductase
MKKILIFGQGNIGTFTGAALHAAGHEVHHYLRNASKARSGIELAFNDRRPKQHRLGKGSYYEYTTLFELDKASQYDIIILPLGHTQFREAIESLTPFIKPQKQLLVIMGNVWADFDWFEQHIPCPYIYCFPNFGGAVVDGKLRGWLTRKFTMGATADFSGQVTAFKKLLEKAGFTPTVSSDITGWLKVHFAYVGGMMHEAAIQGGYRFVAKSFSSMRSMYLHIRKCMEVVRALGTEPTAFAEGREAFGAIWWNSLKMYLMFLLPGVAEGADASFDKKDWLSYSEAIFQQSP